MRDSEEYLIAKKKVENLKGFYIHLTVYITVNILLFATNYLTYDGYWWFIFPLLGWGIGITIHGVTTYLDYNRRSLNWQEKKIKEYMDRNNREK